VDLADFVDMPQLTKKLRNTAEPYRSKAGFSRKMAKMKRFFHARKTKSDLHRSTTNLKSILLIMVTNPFYEEG
jgi:hypothetical protein